MLAATLTVGLRTVGPADAAGPPRPVGPPPRATGLAPVGVPVGPALRPPPRMTGAVPLPAGEHARPAAMTATTTAAARDAASIGRVRLRALIVAVDAADFGIPTWRATLDRVGAAYDILHSRTAVLTPETLVGPDGVGNYNAILLTDTMLLHAHGGGYLSGLDAEEWNRLWAYERDHGVRQAALYTSYGTFPENYCLTGAGEGAVGDAPVTAALTGAGAEIFDYLRTDARIRIAHSYLYRTRLAPGCAAQAVLTAGQDVLGVRTVSPDGRERLALTFTSDRYQLHGNVLAYGLFRWASRGLHLGEQRRFLNVDVDDWSNSAAHLHPDGHVEHDPGFRVSGHDAYNLHQQQVALRAEHPVAAAFVLNLAYNGEGADRAAGSGCAPSGGVDTLTATSRCLAGNFRWINHTLTHPEIAAAILTGRAVRPPAGRYGAAATVTRVAPAQPDSGPRARGSSFRPSGRARPRGH